MIFQQENSVIPCFCLVSPGLERLACTEIAEQGGVGCVVHPGLVSFSAKDETSVVRMLHHLQSVRRFLLFIAKASSPETFVFPSLSPFFSGSLKIEVEGVKGQSRREEITKAIAPLLLASFRHQERGSPVVNVKKPDSLAIVYHDGEEYWLGVDVAGKELNRRDYRIFPHQASWKGDCAYYLIRASGFTGAGKILVGLCKDGTMAIEAALFASRQTVHSVPLPYPQIPLLREISFMPTEGSTVAIDAFDENQQNIIASRKNAALAGVQKFIEFHKYSLDDLDAKYEKGIFEYFVIQVTGKDEEKLNELYYQADYLLAPHGKLLLVGRDGWEPGVSSAFFLQNRESITRGNSVSRLWLLEKR